MKTEAAVAAAVKINTFAEKVSAKDFAEALTVTRTLYYDKVSKTSIVESALACACASSDSFTCTQIASFIVKNLNVSDCFHKRETNKLANVNQSTLLRVRHHIVDTLKHHHNADKLYSYVKASDSVVFTEAYQTLCRDKTIEAAATYRKQVAALIARVKTQYNATVKTVKTAKTKAVKAEAAEADTTEAAAVKTA